MAKLSSVELKERFNRDGYVLLKQLFSKEEIADFRQRIGVLPEQTGDVLTYPTLRPILLDDRVLSSLRAILGPEIVYFGDTAIRNEMKDGTRGFHQDSQDDFADPTNSDYPILRLGIYMQDHKEHSGGLKVRKGSHRHVFLGRQNLRRFLFGHPVHGPLSAKALRLGKCVNIDIEPGDMVIWNLRTWHSGYAVRLKLLPKLVLSPRLEKYIPRSWVIPDEKPRTVIFASFGAPGPILDHYIINRATRPENREHWTRSKYNDPEVLKACAAKGLSVRIDPLEQEV